MSAYVEIIFDNSDNRFPVCWALRCTFEYCRQGWLEKENERRANGILVQL